MRKSKKQQDTERVLKALEDRGIDLIDEVLHLYGMSKKLVAKLFLKWSEAQDDPEKAKLPIESILTGSELDALKFNQNQCFAILKHLFEFTYAKMKALQIAQQAPEAIMFNINIGGEKQLPRYAGQSSTVKKPEALNVSYKQIESK